MNPPNTPGNAAALPAAPGAAVSHAPLKTDWTVKEARNEVVGRSISIDASLKEIAGIAPAIASMAKSLGEMNGNMKSHADSHKELASKLNGHFNCHNEEMKESKETLGGIRTLLLVLCVSIIVLSIAAGVLYHKKDHTSGVTTQLGAVSVQLVQVKEALVGIQNNTSRGADAAEKSTEAINAVAAATNGVATATAEGSKLVSGQVEASRKEALVPLKKSAEKAAAALAEIEKANKALAADTAKIAEKADQLADIKAGRQALIDAAKAMDDASKKEAKKDAPTASAAAGPQGPAMQAAGIGAVAIKKQPPKEEPVEIYKLSKVYTPDDVNSGRVKLTDGMYGKIQARLYEVPTGRTFREYIDVNTPLQLPLPKNISSVRFRCDAGPFTVYLDQP